MSSRKKSYALDQSPLYKLRGLNQLAAIFDLSSQKVDDLASVAHGLYREKIIRDRGKDRLTEVPDRDLMAVQSRLNKLLLRITAPEFLFNPVKGKSAVANAAYHAGARSILTVDVKSYFQSTAASLVFKFFTKRMKCADDVAAILTKLTTYRRHLPTGAPTSPILAYLVNSEMWTSVFDISQKYGIKFSLYMDDITLSGDAVPYSAERRILNVISASGYQWHKKRRYGHARRRHQACNYRECRPSVRYADGAAGGL